MGRTKASINADITKQLALIAKNNSKIHELQQALSALNKAKTTVKWVGQSHSHIKEEYKLAGTPYKEMSEDEKNLSKTCQKDLEAKRDDMVSIVTDQLRTYNSYGQDLASGLSYLKNELAHAKN